MSLNFGINPDHRDKMLAAGLTEDRLHLAHEVESVAYAELRRLFNNMGVMLRRSDIWPTVVNKIKKAGITVAHYYDHNSVGDNDDLGGWYISRYGKAVGVLPHPRIIVKGGRIKVVARPFQVKDCQPPS